MSTVSAVYLVHVRPMEDSRQHKLEILNELTSLTALSITFCFSDLVPANNHNIVGICFDIVILGNICIHMAFIVKSTVSGLIENSRCKKIKAHHKSES